LTVIYIYISEKVKYVLKLEGKMCGNKIYDRIWWKYVLVSEKHFEGKGKIL